MENEKLKLRIEDLEHMIKDLIQTRPKTPKSPNQTPNKTPKKKSPVVPSPSPSPSPHGGKPWHAGNLTEVFEDKEDDDVIHQNQRDLGKHIASKFQSSQGLSHVLVYSPTQSGKTGASIAICEEVSKVIPEYDLTNVFIITGVSMNEWQEQTKQRFEKLLPSLPLCNILKRPDITKIVASNGVHQGRDLKVAENLLFVIDECHIASSDTQTLSKMMAILGYFAHPPYTKFTPTGGDILTSRNIRFVHISATPEGSWNSLKKYWPEDRIYLCKLDVPANYCSLRQLFENGQLRQSGPLVYDSQIPEWYDHTNAVNISDKYTVQRHYLELYNAVLKFSSPKYHVIRSPRDSSKSEDDVKTKSKSKPKFTISYCDLIETNLMEFFGEMGVSIEVITTPEQIKSKVKHILDKDIERSKATGLPRKFEFVSNRQLLFEHIKPSKHTFIIIKDDLKCAVTLPKQHIGILHDRLTNSSNFDTQLKYYNKLIRPRELSISAHTACMKRESFVVQSLLGRATGYGKPETMQQLVVFTDVVMAQCYLRDTFDSFNDPEMFDIYKKYGSCYVMLKKYFTLQRPRLATPVSASASASSAPPPPPPPLAQVTESFRETNTHLKAFYGDLERVTTQRLGSNPQICLALSPSKSLDSKDLSSRSQYLSGSGGAAAEESENDSDIQYVVEELEDYAMTQSFKFEEDENEEAEENE